MHRRARNRRRPGLACRFRVESLEPRLALAADLPVDDGPQDEVVVTAPDSPVDAPQIRETLGAVGQGTLAVGPGASGAAVRLLSRSHTLRGLASLREQPGHDVVVGPEDLLRPRVREALRRAYDAGATVGVTGAGPRASRLLGRILGSGDAAFSSQGPRHADLVAFRKASEGGRTVFHTALLMPRERQPVPPALRREGNAAADAHAARYLDALFSDLPLPSPARPSAPGPAIDLLQQADAYQTSVVQHNNQGHAIQIVNTFYSARSFTNQKDVYYVEQEIAVQGTTSVPTIQATSDNAMLDPVGSPLTRAPSPQSSAQETTITSEVSQSIGGSIGFTQGEGFNATLEAGVTISNSKTVTVPPVSVTYQGNLVTGDTSWVYATTGSQKIRTSTFYNQWLWEVPFSLYSPGATHVTIGTGATNAYDRLTQPW